MNIICQCGSQLYGSKRECRDCKKQVNSEALVNLKNRASRFGEENSWVQWEVAHLGVQFSAELDEESDGRLV
mgnify:FL=1